MHVEKRVVGKKTKYYLSHTYRDDNDKVRKIRKFLGSNLTSEKIKLLTKLAEGSIKARIRDMSIPIFDFYLTRKEVKSINKLNEKIDVVHFDKKEWEQFTEEFVYNTNAIEGSRVLQEEVHGILEKKKPRNSDEKETQGVARAVAYIRETKEDLSLGLILKLHKFCFEGSKSFAGRFRNVEVVIRNAYGEIIHSGTPVENLHRELEEFIVWYKENKKYFKPLILAALVHNHFEDIHPFQDGNGRVGRLLLNFILLKHNYPPINILLEDRMEYYRVLQEFQRGNKLRPTLRFLIRQYKKTLKRVTTKKLK
jgi:Fic family protein